MELDFRRPGVDVLQNARVKIYPDGTSTVLCCSRPVFRSDGWESVTPSPFGDDGAAPGTATDSAARAVRRARARVKDLALCSDFKYFVTLTIDPAELDRYDVGVITKKLNRWLDNAVRRHGLAYILVPERHKDGAVHFHGFINDALRVVDSGTLSDGGRPRRPRSDSERRRLLDAGWHVVFNLPQWGYGFTTAIELYGEYRKAVAYVCKYIGKDSEKIGGRRYYSGGDLHEPEVKYFDAELSILEAAPGAYCFTIPGCDTRFIQVDYPAGKEVI